MNLTHIKGALVIRSFDLFCSDKCGDYMNKYYPTHKRINNTSELKAAVAFDHVAAAYTGNARKNENYIKSDCIMFDIDNTETDRADDWITLDKLRADFQDVEYYVVTSRNHMREKDGKAPRPKYHVYFPIDIITDSGEYTALKKRTKDLHILINTPRTRRVSFLATKTPRCCILTVIFYWRDLLKP